ncbi:MAG: rhomboid family intramembrane serine protease [Planctomycetaceae bacterium]
MGFSDRRYDRFDSGYASEWTAVMTIIVANIAVWVINLLTAGEVPLQRWLSLGGDFFSHPWTIWEPLTYGFLHDDSNPWHLVFNMVALWFFGREVEVIMGRAEFFRFYLTSIVLAGLVWVVSVNIGAHDGGRTALIGASGAVMAVLAVFVWYYPRQTVLIWGILPVPAWALGVLYFVSDVQGAASGGGRVANVAHLAGAIFGAIYAWRGLDLGGLAEPLSRLWRRTRTFPVFRGEQPRRPVERSSEESNDVDLQEQVDRILEKFSRSGESSLTPAERETLERASRRLKQRTR